MQTLLLSIGVDVAMLLTIIALSEQFKKRDEKKKFKKFYVLLPFVFAAIGSIFLTIPFSIWVYGRNVLIYTGLASYSYDFFVNLLQANKDTRSPAEKLADTGGLEKATKKTGKKEKSPKVRSKETGTK